MAAIRPIQKQLFPDARPSGKIGPSAAASVGGPIFIKYCGCPLQTLERVREIFGRDRNFILIPEKLWHRLRPENRKEKTDGPL